MNKERITSVVNNIYAPLIISILSLVIYIFDPAATQWLRYQRLSIEGGEYWRLLTGHLCHLGELHLLFNLLGMWLVTLLLHQVLRGHTWLLVFTFSLVGTSMGLWFFSPQVIAYVGLSGALHGLVVAGGILDLRNLFFNNVILLLGVFGKIIWEQSSYYSQSMSELIGGHVLVESHLYGALAGALIGVVLLLKNKPQPAN
ncbi:MAG: rhombosortase [Pseudomonadales bacterium]|nr:rhombosortase [Pseudomonadales bacterium]